MILGIDQGTTGTTAILLNEKAQVKARFTQAVPIRYPQPGWVEQDPKAVWMSVERAIWGVLSKTNTSPRKIKVIGLTNQRETVSLFDRSKALYPFIVWQDRRTADLCVSHRSQAEQVHRLSATPIDPYFSSTKIEWILKNQKISKANKNIRFRTIESFLLHKMTGVDVTEATNASRTQLLNIKSLKWDDELLEIFKCPRHFAPEVIPSEGMQLRTKGLKVLPDGIPIQAVLGDQQAALFGQLGFEEGVGKITFGTGSFILLNTGNKPVFSKNSLVGTLALQWASGKAQYALEGSAFVCGAWIQWLRDELKLVARSAEIEALAKKVRDSGGVRVIPALTGMGAPFWKPEVRGSIEGLSRGSTRAHIARASLEALCFQNRALIDAMKKDLRKKMKTKWKVDGGAAENSLLMQIQSDVLKDDIERPKNLEATAIGVALLAAKAEGILSLQDIKSSWKRRDLFRPSPKNSYSSLYDKWLANVLSAS